MPATLNANREKVARYRKKLRSQGLRPIQIWVPDTQKLGFKEEVRQQSLAVSATKHEEEIMDFIEDLTDISDVE